MAMTDTCPTWPTLLAWLENGLPAPLIESTDSG